MGDLISKSKLIRDISKVCGDLGIELPDQVIDIITAQPIAYNVDAVVAELEDIKEAVNGCFGIMCSECKYTQKCHTGEMDYKVAIDNAIDIVRKGGVDEIKMSFQRASIREIHCEYDR